MQHDLDSSPLFSGGRFLLTLLLVILVLLHRDLRSHQEHPEHRGGESWVALKVGAAGGSFHPIQTGGRLGSLVQNVFPDAEFTLSPVCSAKLLEPGTEVHLFSNGGDSGLSCAFAPLPERCRYMLGLPMNLNRATKTELTFLPGVGERLAERILLERERRGCFSAVEDILAVRGIGSKLLERIKETVTALP